MSVVATTREGITELHCTNPLSGATSAYFVRLLAGQTCTSRSDSAMGLRGCEIFYLSEHLVPARRSNRSIGEEEYFAAGGDLDDGEDDDDDDDASALSTNWIREQYLAAQTPRAGGGGR